jgi:hypothetical protein
MLSSIEVQTNLRIVNFYIHSRLVLLALLTVYLKVISKSNVSSFNLYSLLTIDKDENNRLIKKLTD